MFLRKSLFKSNGPVIDTIDPNLAALQAVVTHHWPFDEDFRDKSDLGYHLEAVTIDGNISIATASGDSRPSLFCEGGLLRLGGTLLPWNNEDFTIEFWFRPSQVAAFKYILGQWSGSNIDGSFGFWQRFDGTNQLTGLIEGGEDPAHDNFVHWPNSLVVDTWYHVVFKHQNGVNIALRVNRGTNYTQAHTAGIHNDDTEWDFIVANLNATGSIPGSRGVVPFLGYIKLLSIYRGTLVSDSLLDWHYNNPVNLYNGV